MIVTDLRQVVRVFGGHVRGTRAYIPGPGHSREDRSLAIWLCETTPLGIMTHSFAGDPWQQCNDYIAAALGAGVDYWRSSTPPDPAEVEHRHRIRRQSEERQRAESRRKQRFAGAIWEAAEHPQGTVVEVYLRARGLDLPDEIAGEVIRYHGNCPWEGGPVPAMIAPLRDIATGEIVGVHRTRLSPDGRKLDRKMFGTAGGAAVMLDADETIATGITVGEGIETCLAARQMGLRPVWALCSTASIAAFPVLPGIETLSLLAENDLNGASANAVEAACARWHEAGRFVDILTPRTGKDMNDALLARIAA